MQELISGLSKFWEEIPVGIKAVLGLLFGWLLATFLRFVVAGFFSLIKIDTLSEKTGLTEFLRKGNVTYTPSKLAGVFVYWLTLLFSFLEISRLLDIEVMTSLSTRILELVPSLVAAGLVIIIGIVIVTFIGNFTLTIARNAGFHHPEMLSKTIKYLGTFLVFAIAFEQINLGKSIINSMIQILFGASAFGIALAFGLGCKDLAKDAVLRFLQNLREKDRSGKKTDLEG